MFVFTWFWTTALSSFYKQGKKRLQIEILDYPLRFTAEDDATDVAGCVTFDCIETEANGR